MVSFNVSLFLLALPAFLVQAETKLRGNPPDSAVQRDLQTNGYDEWLGQCQGATCGLWGDPHMITCDGTGFDCQGLGAFNIMENHMFKVQGRFVDIGVAEHDLIAGWGLTQGASLTNDIAIQFLRGSDEHAPVFQFGFGDLQNHDGTFPAEDGCTPYQYYMNIDMPGQWRTVETSVADCHDRCERTEGCTKFHYWPDGGCHLNNDGQSARDAPINWPRSLAGPVEACGAPHTPAELENEEERFKTLRAVNNCPLLMHIDGALVDISQVGAYGYFYGDEGTEVRIQNINNHAILMQFTTTDGHTAEAHLVIRGHGPEELWSCHFDFWICLPHEEQEQFMKGTSKGLLGTPDGDTSNDFINADGENIGIHNNVGDWHLTLINYCYQNHCVQQDDSILTPPAGMTFEDIKCEHVDFVPFDYDECVLTPEQISSACSHYAPLLIGGCEEDCCRGGCGQIPEVIDEIVKVKTLSEDEDEILYDLIRTPESTCEDEDLSGTAEDVCPGFDVVKLLHSTGGVALPAGDVFYDITMDAGDDVLGRTVKFKVNNVFEGTADVYVKYEKSVLSHQFLDPKCDPMLKTPSGCNENAVELEVACHDYEGISSFALVEVYFAAPGISGDATVEQCCLDGTEDDRDIASAVKYSFEIQCACPDNIVAPRP
jgi:hypothetical protein